jgi:ParB family chromosome partitioning protein
MPNRIETQIINNIKTDNSSEYLDAQDQSIRPTARRIKNAKWIPISQITPDPDQPRKNYNNNTLQELASSITEYGIRQPIIVEQDQDNFRIVSGERRYRAAKIARQEEIPCIIQENTENTLRYAQQLVENLHREDFSPIDKARALIEYKQLLGKNKPWAAVEKKLGISETRRKQFVALLNLPAFLQEQIVSLGNKPSQNQLTEKHARALLLLKKMPEEQKKLYQQITAGSNIPGDQAIRIAREIKGQPTTQILKISYASKEELIKKLEEKLKELRGDNQVTLQES